MDEQRPVVALATTDLHLVVFLPDGRRAAAGRVPETGPELEDLLAVAVSPTVTETLLEYEGQAWLVQSSGPAWAGEAAADACGIVFTALDGSMERVRVSGLPPGPLPEPSRLAMHLAGAMDRDPASGNE